MVDHEAHRKLDALAAAVARIEARQAEAAEAIGIMGGALGEDGPLGELLRTLIADVGEVHAELTAETPGGGDLAEALRQMAAAIDRQAARSQQIHDALERLTAAATAARG